MSEKKAKFINAKRRGFMQGVAVTGVASGAGVAASGAAQAQSLEQDVTPKESKDRYQENDYVRAYYRNARF